MRDWELATNRPTRLSKANAIKWVGDVLNRTRGKELIGNFNPLLIGALFWEQSSGWKKLAIAHVEDVFRLCNRFLDLLLEDKAPKDVKSRLWAGKIADALKARRQAAFHELDRIMDDLENFPINYNHYYTDTIQKRRNERHKSKLEDAVEAGTVPRVTCPHCRTSNTTISANKVIESFHHHVETDMEKVACEEAIDCLFAIYKVSPSQFSLHSTSLSAQPVTNTSAGPTKDFYCKRHYSSH